MNLTSLKKITSTPKKRLGQGHGSGRVKTSGRGQKGQKARGKVPFTRYSGGSLAFVKRLPFLRGKGKNFNFRGKPVILNVGTLSTLPNKTVVDLKSLIKYNLVDKNDAEEYGIKILGDGKLTTSLTVSLPVSQKAKEKIEKAGGKVEISN